MTGFSKGSSGEKHLSDAIKRGRDSMYMCELVCMNVCTCTHFCMHGKVGMAWELFLGDKEFPPPAGEILPHPTSPWLIWSRRQIGY